MFGIKVTHVLEIAFHEAILNHIVCRLFRSRTQILTCSFLASDMHLAVAR